MDAESIEQAPSLPACRLPLAVGDNCLSVGPSRSGESLVTPSRLLVGARMSGPSCTKRAYKSAKCVFSVLRPLGNFSRILALDR